MFLNVFIKVKKHVLCCSYLQIIVSNIYHHHHHHHQFILKTQNSTMSENTEQNNKTCASRVRKAATALTTAHITKSSTV